MNIDTQYLPLLLEADDTKIRLLSSYINKRREDEIRITKYKDLKEYIQDSMLSV